MQGPKGLLRLGATAECFLWKEGVNLRSAVDATAESNASFLSSYHWLSIRIYIIRDLANFFDIQLAH